MVWRVSAWGPSYVQRLQTASLHDSQQWVSRFLGWRAQKWSIDCLNPIVKIIYMIRVMIAGKFVKKMLQPKGLNWFRYGFSSRIPVFTELDNTKGNAIKIVHTKDASVHLPIHKLSKFLQKKSVSSVELQGEGTDIREITTNFYSQQSWKKLGQISKDTSVDFSDSIKRGSNFVGLASEVLSKGYRFSRKLKDQKSIKIKVGDIPEKDYILELVQAKTQAAEWANSRGDEANTLFLLRQAERIVAAHPQVKIKVIRGKELLKEGFNLLHAVGRASSNEPVFICLELRGGADNDDFVSLVGKGVCFDAGGLNLKSSGSIKGMHIDKHGACSVLSAFESAAKLQVKSNIVAVLGVVQNFISNNSYRPQDIIRSRKGLTVEIGNTDAEGRLVLADCMHWVQQNYKVKTLVELSTLTGAVVIALGKERAGLFTNSPPLAQELGRIGSQIEELVWHMPVDEYHEELIKAKYADITNSSGKSDGSASQAAAFLKQFVEPGVEWAHLDIAGTARQENASGYGAKLLLHFLRRRSAL